MDKFGHWTSKMGEFERKMSDSRRIGIFGGSFDPPHLGHLWIAEAVLESLELDEILWIPAAISPLKPDGPVASNEQRRQMIDLAVSGCEKFRVDDRELTRGDVSYTVDTLDELRAEYPRADLFLIMGSDSLASIRKWHQPRRLLELVNLAVLQRGAEDSIDYNVLSGLATEQQIDRIRKSRVPMPLIELSSSDLRDRVSKGLSIRFRIPAAVETFIRANNLYASPAENPSEI